MGRGWGLGGDVVIGSSSQAFPRSLSGQRASQRNAIHDLTGPGKNLLQDGGFVQVNRELHPQPHKAKNIFPGRQGGRAVTLVPFLFKHDTSLMQSLPSCPPVPRSPSRA